MVYIPSLGNSAMLPAFKMNDYRRVCALIFFAVDTLVKVNRRELSNDKITGIIPHTIPFLSSSVQKLNDIVSVCSHARCFGFGKLAGLDILRFSPGFS